MSVTVVFDRPAQPNQVGISGPIIFNLEVVPVAVPGMNNMYSGWTINIFGAPADNRAICEVLLQDPPESTALQNLRTKIEEGIVTDQQRLNLVLQIPDDRISTAAVQITSPGGGLYEACARVSKEPLNNPWIMAH